MRSALPCLSPKGLVPTVPTLYTQESQNTGNWLTPIMKGSGTTDGVSGVVKKVSTEIKMPRNRLLQGLKLWQW